MATYRDPAGHKATLPSNASDRFFDPVRSVRLHGGVVATAGLPTQSVQELQIGDGCSSIVPTRRLGLAICTTFQHVQSQQKLPDTGKPYELFQKDSASTR